MTRSVSFRIPGKPVPFARTGTNGRQRFTPAKQRMTMGAIKLIAIQAMDGSRLFDGPVELTMDAVYCVPATWSKTKRAEAARRLVYKTSKPDGDNLQKLLKDACNGVVWHDDAQVASWLGRKFYGERDEIVVTITELPA